MKKIAFTVLALLFFLPCTAVTAQDGSNPEIHIPPALSQKEDLFKQELKNLSPAQIEYLEMLDQEVISVVDPVAAIEINGAILSQCAKSEPGLRELYADKMWNYKLRKMDELAANRRAFDQKIIKVDFMDPNILLGHIGFQHSLTMQLFVGTGMMAAEMANEEICRKTLKELDLYGKPYAPERREAVFGKAYFNELSGIKSCGMHLMLRTEDESTISVALIYITSGDQSSLEFSTKIQTPDGPFAPVADTWINFGGIDTRTTAKMTGKGKQTLIGAMPPQYIGAVLTGLKKGAVAVSATASEWSQPYTFIAGPSAQLQLDKMASCAGTVEPRLAEPLRKLGFTVDAAMVSKADMDVESLDGENLQLYRVTSALQNSRNPGACLIQPLPYTREDGKGFGALFAVTGFAEEGAEDNYTASFWIFSNSDKDTGHKFADGRVVVRLAEDNAPFDTADIEQDKPAPANPYKIYLPLGTARPLAEGIIQNGMTVETGIEGEKGVLKHSFSPPGAQTADTIRRCLSDLEADLAQRMKN